MNINRLRPKPGEDLALLRPAKLFLAVFAAAVSGIVWVLW